MIVIADIGESGKLDVREIVNSLSISKLSAKSQIFLSKLARRLNDDRIHSLFSEKRIW
jgi:hypothetical protein